MEKSRYVGVIEGKVRGDDSIKYFLHTKVRSTVRVLERVMAYEVPQNKKISGGGKKWRVKRSRFCFPLNKSK